MIVKYYQKHVTGLKFPATACVASFKTDDDQWATSTWICMNGEEIDPRTYYDNDKEDAEWRADWWHRNNQEFGYEFVGILFK